MFESREELIAAAIYDRNINDGTKHMIANGIQTTCYVCKNIMGNASAMGIPKLKAFDTACRFSFIMNEILTKTIDENSFSQIIYDEVSTGHGRPIIHYRRGDAIFHIKKESNPNKLPKGAKYRREEAKGNGQILLFPEFEVTSPAHMVVTFNHQGFQLKFIQIGMIDPTYERWLFRDDLLPYIQSDTVETMQKEYGAPLEQQAMEQIKKDFRLEMRR